MDDDGQPQLPPAPVPKTATISTARKPARNRQTRLFLGKRLEAAEIIDPVTQTNRNQIFCGAAVTYINDNGIERTVTIVGADEADLTRTEVSLSSPIARALLRARTGDTVTVHGPSGPEQVEILSITYPTN